MNFQSDEELSREEELLMGIGAELTAIRQLLEDGDREQTQNDVQYYCTLCEEYVAEDNRAQHLKADHDGPPTEVGRFFKRVVE